jgi:hypothetical protein
MLHTRSFEPTVYRKEKKRMNQIKVQQPLSGAALGETMTTPAWKSLPSWYLVATNGEAIPPDAARMGATVVEVESSHVAMVSHSDDVVSLIETAAQLISAAK